MAVRQSTRSRTINVRLTDYGDVPNVIVGGVRQSPPRQGQQQRRNDQRAGERGGRDQGQPERDQDPAALLQVAGPRRADPDHTDAQQQDGVDLGEAAPQTVPALPALGPDQNGGGGQVRPDLVHGPRPNVREVAGVVDGEQVLLADMIDPVVPGPHPEPVIEDAEGWNLIDLWGVWDCMLCEFPTMQNIPRIYREVWASAMGKIMRVIERE